MNNEIEINIAHLYPELMNSNGDIGNILALKKRLEWRNIKVNVHQISQYDEIDYQKYDIYFLGGNQDKEQKIAALALQQHKNNLKELAEDGCVMLGVCGGYQLFGHYVEDEFGEKINGLGLLDIYTTTGKNRYTGNVTLEVEFLNNKKLVGFENHVGLTFLNGVTKPLGKIIVGHGNNSNSQEEGARYNNVFGTYLHGAVLPKNPAFCDYLLQLAINRKYSNSNIVLENISDNIENLVNDILINKQY